MTDGAVVPFSSGTISTNEYQTNVKVLNTLLTNLTATSGTNAASNTAYRDSVEDALGGSRIITDAAFETSIGNLISKLSNFNAKQSAEIIQIKAAGSTLSGTGSGTSGHTATSVSIPNCITGIYSPCLLYTSDAADE